MSGYTFANYDEFVKYMSRKPSDTSPLRWVAALPDSGSYSEWLVRWVREER